MFIVQWPWLSGSISDCPADVYCFDSVIHRSLINAYRSDIDRLSYNVRTDIDWLSADIDLTRTGLAILGTSVDPRPNIGRYFKNDVSSMREWEWLVETSENVNFQISFYPIASPLLPQSHGYRTMTMGVWSATLPKWPTMAMSVRSATSPKCPKHIASTLYS